jgi:hypothetical protein
MALSQVMVPLVYCDTAWAVFVARHAAITAASEPARTRRREAEVFIGFGGLGDGFIDESQTAWVGGRGAHKVDATHPILYIWNPDFRGCKE